MTGTMPVTITGYDLFRIKIPAGRLFGDCTCTFDCLYAIGVCLKTDAGHSGWGFSETLFGGEVTIPAHYIVPMPPLFELRARFEREIWPLIVGRNAFEVRIREGGALQMHMATRTALWDLRAQQAELPLYRLLGGEAAKNRVRAYASGLDFPLTDEQAGEWFAGMAHRGFTAVKVKVGSPS